MKTIEAYWNWSEQDNLNVLVVSATEDIFPSSDDDLRGRWDSLENLEAAAAALGYQVQVL